MSVITCAKLQYGTTVVTDPKKEQAGLAALVEDIPIVLFDTAAGINNIYAVRW